MSDLGELYELRKLDEPLEENLSAERRQVADALADISTPIDPPAGYVSPGPGYVFASIGRCRSFECERSIAWFRTPAGKTAPYDPTGISHFATCTAAERFRRRRSERKEGLMPTKAIDQLALDERVVDDPTLERLLEARQKTRDVASLAAAKAKTASEAAASAIEGLDLGIGTAIRIGRFRIELTSRPARAISFETAAKEGVKISLVDDSK